MVSFVLSSSVACRQVGLLVLGTISLGGYRPEFLNGSPQGTKNFGMQRDKLCAGRWLGDGTIDDNDGEVKRRRWNCYSVDCEVKHYHCVSSSSNLQVILQKSRRWQGWRKTYLVYVMELPCCGRCSVEAGCVSWKICPQVASRTWGVVLSIRDVGRGSQKDTHSVEIG